MLKGRESSSLGGTERREAGVGSSGGAEPESSKPASSTCPLSSIQSPDLCASRVPGCPGTSPGWRGKGNCGHSVLFTLRISSVSPLCGRHGGGPSTASIRKSALGLSLDSSLVVPGSMWTVVSHL